jgi:hypothetical protein
MYFDHQTKGAYIDLMILQFNVGKFTEAQAKQVLSICFSVAWPMLQQKFKTDGVFYWNERLQQEIEKRQNFTKSRRENALGEKKNKAYAKASDEHMHKHMEDENENRNKVELKIKKDKPKLELNFPCPEMEGIWLTWTAYKKAQHKEVYKTAQSAQIQVNNLWALADQNPVNALAIINHSMGNLWKGLIKPKTESNGTNQQQHKPNPLASFNRAAKDAVEAERLLAERQGDGGDLFTEVYGQAARFNVRD